MGTIAITITNPTVGAPYPLTKTYTVADTDITKIVTAYQSAANVSVNGTATLTQVWLYLAGLLAAQYQTAVQGNLTTPPVVPSPITFT